MYLPRGQAPQHRGTIKGKKVNSIHVVLTVVYVSDDYRLVCSMNTFHIATLMVKFVQLGLRSVVVTSWDIVFLQYAQPTAELEVPLITVSYRQVSNIRRTLAGN